MKNIKTYIVLHILIILLSIGGVSAKTASSKEFLSFDFFLFYGIAVLINILFAILWQQIIKRIPLNSAYVTKSMTLVWNAILGIILFHEVLSLNNIIGIIIVGCGVILITTGGEKRDE